MEMLFTVIRLAVRGLLAYKARSLLTMLGIIIGIGAVIIMISVGRGANMSIQEQINDLGANMLMVFSGSTKKGGVRGGYGSNPTLKVKDAEAILRECPAVLEVTHVTSQNAQLVSGEKNWSATVSGNHPKLSPWSGTGPSWRGNSLPNTISAPAQAWPCWAGPWRIISLNRERAWWVKRSASTMCPFG